MRDESDEQKLKACSPILVTEFGIERVVRDEHLLKVERSIEVTEFGIVKERDDEQPKKA